MPLVNRLEDCMLTPKELDEIRARDAKIDDKWFRPSMVLAPHNTCYQDRRKLLQHIIDLEKVRDDREKFAGQHR